jgi:hypothetical protein
MKTDSKIRVHDQRRGKKQQGRKIRRQMKIGDSEIHNYQNMAL